MGDGDGDVPRYPEKATVADVFLQSLEEADIDYVFTVLGSDHASIIEAYQTRIKNGKLKPKMLIFHHEFVAISAADGYARITRKPQCVLVHVDVGTAALGQGLHNASSGKAPVLIFAGLAPTTFDGVVRGSRSEHVQWYQDVRGQEKLVEPYSRFSGRFSVGEDVKIGVERALMIATTGCPGPVYLTATREVLASEAVVRYRKRPVPCCRLGSLPKADLAVVGRALVEAERPLAITGYLGRNHGAVDALVRLADLIKGLQVFDSEFREMSFPADHPAKISQRTGARPAIETADVVLVLDCDVPWIPAKVRPSESARIFHVDCDPRKEFMQVFDVGAEATFYAECSLALEDLCAYVEQDSGFSARKEEFQRRGEELEKKHQSRLETLASINVTDAGEAMSTDTLFRALRRYLPSDTIHLSDVVTNQPLLAEQLQLTNPGTNLTKGGSGLGWAPGAAIGVTLASQTYDLRTRPGVTPNAPQKRMICCVTGDGSFLFSNADAVYLASMRLGTPFLTVVVNNGGWKATRACIDDVHPGGVAAGAGDEALGIDLGRDGPDYVGIAVAASGGRMWGTTVRDGEGLGDALVEAERVVLEEGRSAMLEVLVA